MLENGVHLRFTDGVNETNGGLHLIEETQWLRRHDREARRMGAVGRENGQHAEQSRAFPV